MCLGGAGEVGYPEPRFYEFFRAFPNERSKRIKQFVIFFSGIMVKELTALLKNGEPCKPSDFWKYQEDEIEYEQKLADEVAEYMKKEEYQTAK